MTDTRRIDIDVSIFTGQKFPAVLIVDGDYDKPTDTLDLCPARIDFPNHDVYEALVRADCHDEMSEGL